MAADPQQRLLYVSDTRNALILVYDRRTLALVGESAQQGLRAHAIAVDSKGNIYTAELADGVRRLVLKGKSSPSVAR